MEYYCILQNLQSKNFKITARPKNGENVMLNRKNITFFLFYSLLLNYCQTL